MKDSIEHLLNPDKAKDMKINIELNIVGDGRIFLNYWDSIQGNDVICEFRRGKLFNKSGIEVPIGYYLKQVEKSAIEGHAVFNEK